MITQKLDPVPKRSRRPRTPREEIVAHLAWWWMGSLSPTGYARAHGIEPVVFERWMRSHLIFKPECGARKFPAFERRRRHQEADTKTDFVTMVVAQEGVASC